MSATIMDFLKGLSASQDLTRRLRLDQVKWIILDGCDEAATQPAVLSKAIADLAFPKALAVVVRLPKGAHLKPEVPQDLRGRVQFDETNKKLVQLGPISVFDYQRLLALNEGTPFAAPLRSLSQQAKNAPRVVVTTREPLAAPTLKWFVRIRLAPLTDGQLAEFFRRWFHSSPEDAAQITEFLKGNPHIRDVCRTPIVATLVAALHQNGVPLPLSKTDVYARRFELLTEQWDKARGVAGRNRFTGKDKLVFLQRLALRLQLRRRRVFDTEDAEIVWSKGIASR